jgi:hypothetical protein
MDATPSIEQALEAAIESRVVDIHTAMVCQVQKYNADDQTVNVLPVVRRPVESLEDGGYVAEDLPILARVPIAHMRAGSKFLSMPLSAGDYVLVVFNTWNLGNWRELGKVSDPPEIGHCTISSPIAIPCCPWPTAEVLDAPNTTDMIAGTDGGAMVRYKDDTVEVVSDGGEDAADFVAMAAKVNSIVTKIMAAFSGWTPVPGDGGAALKASWSAQFPSPPSSVASTVLKAD